MKQNYFELFGLPTGFAVDLAELAKSYRQLALTVHPDKFAAGTDNEKRTAMQWTVHVNEAHTVLRDPLKRAIYLLQLTGVDIDAESNTAMPNDFLMQQMDWRERTADAEAAHNLPELNGIQAEIAAERKQLLQELSDCFTAADTASARIKVRQLMFIEKMLSELDLSFAVIED